MQIRCRACDTDKPSTEYYAKSFNRAGVGICRECWKARVIKRRRTNPAVQEYERQRAKQPHRRAKARDDIIRWRAANPELYRAQNAINNAIRDGKLVRGACACGATRNVFGIAADPAEPLNVRWQCALCYRRSQFAVPSDTKLILLDTFKNHVGRQP